MVIWLLVRNFVSQLSPSKGNEKGFRQNKPAKFRTGGIHNLMLIVTKHQYMNLRTFTLQSLFTLALILQSLPARSCSCAGPYDTVFCAAVAPNTHIFYGKVLERTHPYYMRVAVLENIYRPIAPDTITMMGQDGVNCGENLDLLSVGAEYVLAVYDEPINGQDTFLLGGCSKNFYLKQGDTVLGQITPGIRDISYTSLRDNISDLLGCTLTDHSFVSEANRWNILTGWLSIQTGNGRLFTEIYRFQDTIQRNGQVYHKLWVTEGPNLQSWEYSGWAFREGPPGKVYKYWEFNQEEVPAYDFTLEEGEEITFGDFGDPFVVRNVDFIRLPDGSVRKRMLASPSLNTSFTVYWIEGIGSERSTFEPAGSFVVDAYIELLCYYQEEALLHVTDYAREPEGCYQIIVNTKEASAPLSWKVFPNPVSEQLNITFPQPVPEEATLRLLNHLGQAVGERRLPAFTERANWQMASLPPGLYFVELRMEGGLVGTKRFLIFDF